jgi:hypothetical protein
MKKFDFKLFLIVLFLGWFGIDKLVFKNWRMCLIKLFSVVIVFGIAWNIYDIVCVALNKYKVNPVGV